MVKAYSAEGNNASIRKIWPLVTQFAYPRFHLKPMGQQIHSKEGENKNRLNLLQVVSAICFPCSLPKVGRIHAIGQFLSPLGP